MRLPRVNLLIADDVGAGKTVEAGLVLREMLLRRRVDLVLVATPAGMVRQWQDELETKFGLTFTLIDREHLATLRRERGYTANPMVGASPALAAAPEDLGGAGKDAVSEAGVLEVERETLDKSVPRRNPGDLDAQIVELLAPLTDDITVWQQLTVRFRADVFCGLFLKEANEGGEISSQTLLALGSRGLTLGLDIYRMVQGVGDA